ncbi:hemolysin family protein [Deinococcus sp.]|uniref:hemolysin family protein n=1 Tax=Deinococcus sp. TaxID=47478 RepID=UPI0025C583D7|nr:hemolysin family protein [Deinococcus sp.]
MNAALPLLVIVVMVAVNALYVAAEFAAVGARRSRVQETAEGGNRAAGTLLGILQDPQRLDTYVAACQIGITLSSLVAGAYGQSQLTPLLTPSLGAVGGEVAATAAVLILVTALQVVLGELLPKTVALRYPERLALATLRPIQLSLLLFRPLIALFNGTAFAILRAAKMDVQHSHAHVHSPEELQDLYRESADGGLIDANERQMLSGVLNVEDRVVREIMTPRTRTLTVPADLSVREALTRLAPSAYSRFPVTAATSEMGSEEVVGVVHLRSLFLSAERSPEGTVRSVMREPLVVAEVMGVPDLWRRLRDSGRHSALVVNEYGSVSGFVTLEDALEEIFGELQDEFDQEEEPISVQGGRVLVRGDVLIDVLNSRFDLDLPTDEVDTVSGLIWQELGRLPQPGDEVSVTPGDLMVRVEAMERRAVKRASFAAKGERA